MTNTLFDRRMSAGAFLDTRSWPTLAGPAVAVPYDQGVTHIQFRRFAGCPVCNVHLRSFIGRRDELDVTGVHEIVVFHSPVEELAKYEADLPFDVVPDPKKKLYREFGVEEGRKALLDPRVWWPIAKAVSWSAWNLIRHPGTPVPPLQPPGGRFGLPADLLIDADGCVLAAHYGSHASDQWSVDQVLQFARRR